MMERATERWVQMASVDEYHQPACQVDRADGCRRQQVSDLSSGRPRAAIDKPPLLVVRHRARLRESLLPALDLRLEGVEVSPWSLKR
jgi:hypothetical protein